MEIIEDLHDLLLFFLKFNFMLFLKSIIEVLYTHYSAKKLFIDFCQIFVGYFERI